MTRDDADKPQKTRDARLKAALKANLARRKAQARARTEDAPAHPDTSPQTNRTAGRDDADG